MSTLNRTIATFLMMAAFLGGCQQRYTGSMGIDFRDQKKVQAYQKFKQQQAEHLKDARLAEKRVGPVDFEAPHTQAMGNVAADRPAVSAASFATSPKTGTQRRHSVGTLGLFGHVRSSTSSSLSPLDSTGDLQQMTFTAEGADFDPDTNPTGTKIVYASTRHRDTADLYVKRVAGSAIMQLTSDPANEVMPTFSPDGEWVAFASDRSGTWDIYLMPAAGGRPRQLTNSSTDDLHPSFSPDGKRLVYCSIGSASGQWEMVVIDVANPATKQVIGLGLFPTWSPTQETILFQRARQRGTRWFSVWTVDLVNGEPTPPTEIAVSANAAVITPDWSPDGKRVVFCTVIDPTAEEEQSPAQADIWITEADGTGRVRLTTGQFASLQPAWSADGSILFVSNRAANGIENIWAVRPGRSLDFAKPASQGEPTSVMVPTN